MKPYAEPSPVQKEAVAAAKKSLRDSLGAVSAVIADMPRNTVVRMADAFLLIDPGLCIMHRQIADSRSHAEKIAALLGAGDPMMEALAAQITALEEAYAQRLAALKRKREEGRKENKFHKVEVKNLPQVRGQEDQQKSNNDILWLWMFLMLLANQASMKKSGPRLEAA
ncbi:MAG: hypothetical protein KGQ41_05235 [Alphaproteobacteria bacterium]|nr:hypothetical protein [Alphaproteobacteria bacterium]